MTDIKCILHVDQDLQTKNAPVIPFKDSSWQCVIQAAEYRKKSRSSKYVKVVDALGTTYGEGSGYHSVCYKNFTAIPKERKSDAQSALRKSRNTDTTDRAGIFPEHCIFCKNKVKNVKRKVGQVHEKCVRCEQFSAQYEIVQAAVHCEDENLLLVIRDVDFIAKEVKYHNTCKKSYIYESKKKPPSTRACAHIQALDAVKPHIEHIIQENKAVLLSKVHAIYLNVLSDNGFPNSTYDSRSLEVKLLSLYNDTIIIQKVTNRYGKVICPVNMDSFDALAQIEQKSSMISILEEAALILRDDVLEMKKNSDALPFPLTASDIAKGEGYTPPSLKHFFQTLYSSQRYEASTRLDRVISSSCEDVIYNITNGSIKPSKHCLLGLGLKSMTGSKKVITTLNKYGHSISYHVAEELETELAMSISEKGHEAPDGLQLKEGLATGFAFDNYDENTETLSGGNTLHDTVGIVYQNIIPGEEGNDDRPDGNGNHGDKNDDLPVTRKRQRSLDVALKDVPPYRKKAKILTFDFDEITAACPPNYTSSHYKDLAFTLLSSLNNAIPLWSGWNSLIHTDTLPQQRICYLQNINLPPTRLDVVAETLRTAQKIAQECNEPYAIVTYDLAIAKPASQIRNTEDPLFKNLFIMWGAFHIMMAFFACLGFFLDGSGGDTILTDSDVSKWIIEWIP